MVSKVKTKLVISCVSVVIALVLVASTTFAWFTLSTNPEINGISLTIFSGKTLLLSPTGEEDTFEQYINLSERFENLAPLKPVSTYDGINWFLPTYNGDVLAPAEDFVLDNTLEHGNVSLLDENEKALTGVALVEAKNKGYYVYTDFYIKSELEDGCTVRLSVPSSFTEEDIEYKSYGSYVMPDYEYDDSENSITDVGKNCTTAVRVGFLLYGDGEDNDPTNFMIYEPNGTTRSYDKTDVIVNQKVKYVLPENCNIKDYVNGNYFETKPIKVCEKDGDNPGEKVPYYDTVSLLPQNLIVQETCKYDETVIKSLLSQNKQINSSCIDGLDGFGKFYDTATLYQALASSGKPFINPEAPADENISSGLNLIYNLPDDTPVKIRLFIWIEGQDIDCWNDIAGGRFVVNLELAGVDN